MNPEILEQALSHLKQHQNLMKFIKDNHIENKLSAQAKSILNLNQVSHPNLTIININNQDILAFAISGSFVTIATVSEQQLRALIALQEQVDPELEFRQAVWNDPYYVEMPSKFVTMSRAEAEKRLAENPMQPYLIRYSDNAKTFVISHLKELDQKEYEHVYITTLAQLQNITQRIVERFSKNRHNFQRSTDYENTDVLMRHIAAMHIGPSWENPFEGMDMVLKDAIINSQKFLDFRIMGVKRGEEDEYVKRKLLEGSFDYLISYSPNEGRLVFTHIENNAMIRTPIRDLESFKETQRALSAKIDSPETAIRLLGYHLKTDGRYRHFLLPSQAQSQKDAEIKLSANSELPYVIRFDEQAQSYVVSYLQNNQLVNNRFKYQRELEAVVKVPEQLFWARKDKESTQTTAHDQGSAALQATPPAFVTAYGTQNKTAPLPAGQGTAPLQAGPQDTTSSQTIQKKK